MVTTSPIYFLMDVASKTASASTTTCDVVERALYELQDRYPTAPIAAVDATGLIVSMPDSVRSLDNPILTGRSGLDGDSDEDRPRFIATFDRVLSEGMAHARCTRRDSTRSPTTASTCASATAS